jgi:hypothetical protein
MTGKHSMDEAAETVTGVALLFKDGSMIALPRPYRHHHLFATMSLLRINPGQRGEEQGFTTSHGRFVGREDGLRIVKEAGQTFEKHGNAEQLYSEDLW